MYPSIQEESKAQGGMEELLDQVEPPRSLQRGDVVEGVIMRVDQEGILVSIGHKSEGFVPAREMNTLSPESREHLQVGATILTLVLQPDQGDQPAVLSVDHAREEQGWVTLEHHLETGQALEAEAVSYNRGGLIVDIEGVQGFVPLSQLAPLPRSGAEPDSHQGTLAQRVGDRLSLKVIELNRRRSRVILSERVALQERREEQKRRLVEELQEGEVRRGRITSICNFGAFVDLGGADGLIHISELSWDMIQSPEQVVEVGEDLDVYVLHVDTETKRIALSLRRLQPEPWETITDRYYVGQLVTGTITKLVDFGAFARIEGSVEGLIHISELSHRLIQHPKEVVKEGDVLTVKILRIEPERRRLGLSLKQVEEEV